MSKPTTDESVFQKIEGLVHEEQHLYGKSELADHDQVRLEGAGVVSRVAWIPFSQTQSYDYETM